MNFLPESGIPATVSHNLLDKHKPHRLGKMLKKSRYITVLTVICALFIIFNPSIGAIIAPLFNPIYTTVYGKERYLQNGKYIIKPISSSQVASISSSIDDPAVRASKHLVYVIPGPEISSVRTTASNDPRYLALERFLAANNSPMINHVATFLSAADRYHLDWRLLPAISGAESGFGRVIPITASGDLSYNGWGWTGSGAGGFQVFSSWDDAINTIAKDIAISYGTHITPMQMEPTYCPPCTATNHWEQEVNEFMYEISPTK